MNFLPENIDYFDLAYLTSTTLAAFIVYLGVFKFLTNFERKRVKRIDKKDFSYAVDTSIDERIPSLKNINEIGLAGLKTRFDFFKRALPYLVLTLWMLFTAFPYLGKVPATYLSILLAVVSVIVGTALRPVIENFFCGLVISFSRPVRIGDTVMMDGEYGVIENIRLMHTVIRAWDWRRLVVPNSSLLSKDIINYTLDDQLIWAHVEFWVEPSANFEKVEKIASECMRRCLYYHPIDAPAFWIMGMEKDSVKCWVAGWAKGPSDAWELKTECRARLVKSLSKKGIKLSTQPLSITSNGPSQRRAAPPARA